MFRRKLATVLLPLVAVSVAGMGICLSVLHALAREQQDTQKDAEKLSEPEARGRSAANLTKIGAAMWDYWELHRELPPAALVRKDGTPLLSWRVLLLPYLGEHRLFQQFKFEEPWDSPHNKKLLAHMPRVYAPVWGKTREPHLTYYQVFTGKRTLFEGNRGCRLADIPDGTSLTILLVEAAEAVPWTRPADLPYDAAKPIPKLGGLFQQGFHFETADGGVRFGRKDFDEKLMRLAIVRDDGEAGDLDKLEVPR